jgi:hypothetical protein
VLLFYIQLDVSDTEMLISLCEHKE